MAASTRHETRALLRAHLSAASSYRHLTRHCPICHRLLRLAMDSAPPTVQPTSPPPVPPAARRTTPQASPPAAPKPAKETARDVDADAEDGSPAPA
ncbi:DUF6274 family protein [Streptomyces sp. NPDC006332]|uniref:DUF6274 family protein n=1 Tax=Streptomyces sp. NPDC006332 TaxID=3155456 RepID=UPI0033B53AED